MRFFIDSLIGLVLLGLLSSVLLYNRKKQRLLFDGLIGLLLVGVVASMLMHRRESQLEDSQRKSLSLAVAQLQDQAVYRGVLEVHDSGRAGYPAAISPEWFKGGLPMNTAIPGWQPWVDVAPTGDLSQDPPDPVISRSGQAGFWYNPNVGIVRARVPMRWSESATAQLYNDVNGTEHVVLAKSQDATRQPRELFSVLTDEEHKDTAASQFEDDPPSPARSSIMTPH